MSESSSTSTPLYILKWRMGRNERGRKHMAVFVPNPQFKGVNPDGTRSCLGTVIHVQGSPLTGFELNIKRNWDRQKTLHVESVHFLSWVHSQYVPEPAATAFLADDPGSNGLLDEVARVTRPPGVSSPLWDPNAIFDCQDWVYDYMKRLSQRKVVDVAVLSNLQTFMDAKTALMATPGGGATQGSALTHTPVLTASVAKVAAQAAAQPVQPARGRYSNSEWDATHGFFKRYDHTAKQWEYRDSNGTWKPI